MVVRSVGVLFCLLQASRKVCRDWILLHMPNNCTGSIPELRTRPLASSDLSSTLTPDCGSGSGAEKLAM